MLLSRWRTRQDEKVVVRAHAVIDRQPGEPITHVVVGSIKPGLSLFSLFVRMFAYGADWHHYWLVTTDRRVFLVRLNAWGTRAIGIEWQSRLYSVTVAGYREGFLWTVIDLRRRGEEADTRLVTHRRYQRGTRAVAQLLGGWPVSEAPAPHCKLPN